DHGVMYGVVDFYAQARKRGIHPVIGCEVYTCANMADRQTREANHLILLCQNEEGYRNITRLVSAGWTRGFYYKPRIDFSLLQQHHEGLIALSACLSGEIPQRLLDGRVKEARILAERMRDLFGPENFYLEIQDHGMEEQRRVLPLLIALSQETGIPLVATNDAHYLRAEDAEAQEVLLCIQTGKTLQDENRMRMTTQELYVKSPAEMAALFPQWPEALENTVRIAARCQMTFDFDTIHLPRYPVPQGTTATQMLHSLCEAGLQTRYAPENQEAHTRLAYELSMIERMGYVDYFLIVWDFIRYAKQQNIMVGPGRGSGAGSIVAYTLDITGIDPLQYQLLFERFLNPERTSMPDLDIDFCYERRQEVIDYVARRYGEDHVAQIITFGTMAAKAVLRDVGRVLDYPYAEVDAIAKMVPFALEMTLDKALALNPDLQHKYDEEERIRRLFDIARTLEGMPRHASTHAAGVLITKEPVTEYVPLQKNDEVITTQYPMGTLEKLGLLKMDFLGLRTLTVIRDTLDMIRDVGVDLRAEQIPLHDPAVYQMISNGDTDGVFQLEGGGMRTFLTNMRPACFEDIIAAISLYRPGPMDSIPRYIQGRQDPSSVQYLHPLLKPILDVTYGCMVYQEQVMQIVRDLAGYSMGRSDLVRRAMAKKKKDVMAEEREYFIHGLEKDGTLVVPGAVRNGVPEDAAALIFEEMSTFASYAFNKSHAAAYGVIAVQTGWLKCHYPVQFMASLMNSVIGNSTKIAGYIQYCRQHDIPVLPPDVNRSQRKFSVDRSVENKAGIRFGLVAVKNAGQAAVDAVIRQRITGGDYQDLYDFVRRVDADQINKRMVESLIRAGAFDSTGARRSQLLAVYESAMESASQVRKRNVAGQISLFGDLLDDTPPPLPACEETPLAMQLAMEKEVTGVYISGHPLDAYRALLEKMDCSSQFLTELAECEDRGLHMDGVRVQMGGMVQEIHTKMTKSGGLMAFITLEDLTGQVEGLIFPKAYERLQNQLQTDQPVLLQGKLSVREEDAPKLLVESVSPLQHPVAPPQPSAPPRSLQRLHLRVQDMAQMQTLTALLQQYPGNLSVCFHLRQEKKTLLAPESLRCDGTPSFLALLAAQIGAENVKIKTYA
ncbi:MAG: DNA polymerase III subunit alpha, partial [Clostridia bacterium]